MDLVCLLFIIIVIVIIINCPMFVLYYLITNNIILHTLNDHRTFKSLHFRSYRIVNHESLVGNKNTPTRPHLCLTV